MAVSATRNVMGQRSRPAAPPAGAERKGTPGIPCCFRLTPRRFSPQGRDTAVGRNTRVKRTARLGVCPLRTPIGRARCSILLVNPTWAAVRRAGLDPRRPIPGPGTGPSSFLGRKHWQKPEYIIQYSARRTLTQGLCRHCAQSVRKTLSADPGAVDRHRDCRRPGVLIVSVATCVAYFRRIPMVSQRRTPPRSISRLARLRRILVKARSRQDVCSRRSIPAAAPCTETRSGRAPHQAGGPSAAGPGGPRRLRSWPHRFRGTTSHPSPANLHFRLGPATRNLQIDCKLVVSQREPCSTGRNRPLTESVRCFSPVGGDFPAIQP